MTSHDVQLQDGRGAGGSAAAPGAGSTRPTAWRRVIGMGFGLSLAVGLIFTAFAWPNSQIEPREVPIAVVAPPQPAAQVEQQLEAAVPGGFEVQPAPDPDAARDLIADREVYGAIVLDPAGPPRVLTATAASPAVAQLLQGIGDELARASTEAPDAPAGAQVEDVVAAPADDPRGTGFSAAALPMVIASMAAGYAMAFGVSGVWRRLAGVAVAAAAGGLVAGLVVQTWLGVLDGDYWLNSAVFALTIAAIATTLVGLTSLLGRVGAAVGALAMLLLGNPLSGVTSAPELLPTGWGALGQLLPPGAAGTLLRSTAFFDGAAAGGPLLVLGGWLAAGLLLVAAGQLVRRRAAAAGRMPVAVSRS